MNHDISGKYKKTKKTIFKIFIKFMISEAKYYLGYTDYEIKRRYKKEYGNYPDLCNPKTYSEKLLFLKAHYRNPLQTICADKYYVCEYVKMCGYEHILRNFYAIYRNSNEINYKDLPERFFIRCNNRSGLNFIIDKKKVEEKTLKTLFKMILKNNYYHSMKEWPYKNILPCIICEEVLENKDKSPLTDYKFYCFSGKPHYFMVSYGEYDHDVKNIKYDMDGHLIDYYFKKTSKLDARKVQLPENIDEMIEIASTLCRPFPHVRVDLYNIEGKIYFGEMTFYSNAGVVNVYSKEYDKMLASLIKLDEYKIDFI